MTLLPALVLLWYCLRQWRRSEPRWRRTKGIFVAVAVLWVALSLAPLLSLLAG